jgi:hypothetical protein
MPGLAVCLLVLVGCGFRVPPGGGDPTGDAGADTRDGEATNDTGGFVPFVARYNLFGPAFTGTEFPGVWAADPGAPNGICGPANYTAITTAMSGTIDDPLFVNQVYGVNVDTTCAIGLAPGNYAVTLLFGETYYGPGCPSGATQTFSIALEGTIVEPSLNLSVEAGGCMANGGTGRPVMRRVTLAVTDGTLDIVEHAPTGIASMISAIEVIGVP